MKKKEKMYRTIQKKPTEEQYGAYQKMYDYFNERLFEPNLPQCLFSFSRGPFIAFFSPKSWYKEENEIHEISINPDHIGVMPVEEIAASLVHEMCHLWQATAPNGKPSRKSYHNKQWAKKMESVGLIPSDTGKPGGKKTGQHMLDYPQGEGPFIQAYQAMPECNKLPWMHKIPFYILLELGLITPEEAGINTIREVRTVKNKHKYSCGCGTNVWGKPGLEKYLFCTKCNQRFHNVS